ncbi:D-cysteine desulfhydrase family protein [Rheinheimera salexigens]|uniref:D-cysteine desulfhydrase n=1 Tax=Rheinheimera salexigens TaxID=1628148 RepID=A0A1E7Q280_9GAMM|nr:D-cysteine desulfhydrase [Rheinheimera salexigens]OEY68239.1 D-cysteine desulfhydrase [Rheinheimera salexigens]
MIPFAQLSQNFTKLVLSHQPTPLEVAARMSSLLGIKLLIKRDDCTGLAGGGNKTRKLEYLLADAQKHQADTLITIGGIQSNHARQTAAAAAKFGFDCELILQDVAGAPTDNYSENGNILLNSLCGATVHKLSINDDCQQFAQQRINELTSTGKKPYLIPIGGSNVIGSMGYVQCAYELVQQINQQQHRVDHIVLATGSAGTQAGLLAGLIAADSDIPVLGINVSRPVTEQNPLVEQLLRQVLQALQLDPALAKNRVHTNGDYYGEGYGISSSVSESAIKLLAQQEGLLLDPVYTGKAMAGLIDLVHSGQLKPNSTVLFLHTGGSQALFAYRSCFNIPIYS